MKTTLTCGHSRFTVHIPKFKGGEDLPITRILSFNKSRNTFEINAKIQCLDCGKIESYISEIPTYLDIECIHCHNKKFEIIMCRFHPGGEGEYIFEAEFKCSICSKDWVIRWKNFGDSFKKAGLNVWNLIQRLKTIKLGPGEVGIQLYPK